MAFRRIIPALIAAALLALPVAALADFISGSDSYVPSSKTINDDLYISGSTVTVSGTVNGDVYAAGSNVLIEGTVKGDVLAVGQTLNIRGNIQGSVRLAGQTVNLSGAQIGGSASVAGQNVSADDTTKIGGGLQAAGQTVTIRADVARGIAAGATSFTFGGKTGKGITVASGRVRIESPAVIRGKLVYHSKTTADIAGGSTIAGGVEHRAPPPSPFPRHGFTLVFHLIEYGAALVTGLVLLLLFRRPAASASLAGRARPWSSMGIGLAALILTIPICVILAITLIGLPLAAILFVLFLISLYLAKLIVILGLAARSDDREIPLGRSMGVLAIGLAAYYLLTLIPFVGWLIGLIVTIWGLGAIIRSAYGRRHLNPAV